jgi:hypothetical protein
VLKHIIYVGTRPDMSRKWVGRPNHNLQHDPSEKSSESPTANVSVSVRPSSYQAGVAYIGLGLHPYDH